jgi:hypothetical protein
VWTALSCIVGGEPHIVVTVARLLDSSFFSQFKRFLNLIWQTKGLSKFVLLEGRCFPLSEE